MTEKKRNRRTRKEMIELRRQQLEKLLAEEEGRLDELSEGSALVKRLKNRLRKTETQLRAARITLDGVANSEGKGWARSPIDEKIAHTERRLASQQETKARAEEAVAAYPFDIERLTALVAAAEQGEEVDYPTDLTPLPGENDQKSDEEHEAEFIANGENAES